METRTEPFFFGEGGRLLGFHTTAAAVGASRSALICPSVFSDTTRSHWLIRQLSLRLAAEGLDVFRFDFSGCGNSRGGPSLRRPAPWMDDLRSAVKECTIRSGRSPSAVFTLRAGALLWSRCEGLPRIERLVCWDPVATGADFLAEMEALQAVYEARAGGGDFIPALGGHAVDSGLGEELEGLGGVRIEAEKTLLLRSRNPHRGDPGHAVPTVDLDNAYDWSTWVVHIFYPHDVIQHTCDFMKL